jgi:hypothetical protein
MPVAVAPLPQRLFLTGLLGFDDPHRHFGCLVCFAYPTLSEAYQTLIAARNGSISGTGYGTLRSHS